MDRNEVQEKGGNLIRLGSLDPLRVAKVPVFCGIWTAMGSGLIWASMAMGSGELIWWPYLTAKYGKAFVGLLLPACVMQYFVNQEITRYTVTTGEGMFQGFARIHYMFAIFMWVMMVISFAWFGSYATSGTTALYELTHFPPRWSPRAGTLFWAYIVILIFFLVLLVAKFAYRAIELFMKAVVVVCVGGVLLAITNHQVLNTANDFFSAYFDSLYIFKNGWPTHWESSDSSVLLTAICFAGMGGFMNVMYSYWIREKGIGMSRLVGKVAGPLTNDEGLILESGYAFADSTENKRNYLKWIQYMRLDNLVAVGLNILVAMLMCWLAWTTLLPAGEYPKGWEIAVVQSKFFAAVFGPIGRLIFLVIAAAFLCDLWIGIADACARMHADFFRSTFKFAKEYTYKKLYFFFVIVLTAVSCITIPFSEPGVLLVLVGVFNFMAMPVYCPALIYLNYFKIPRAYPNWTRPRKSTLIIFSIVSIIYSLIAIWYLKVIFEG